MSVWEAAQVLPVEPLAFEQLSERVGSVVDHASPLLASTAPTSMNNETSPVSARRHPPPVTLAQGCMRQN
jgi:hypothetical protein